MTTDVTATEGGVITSGMEISSNERIALLRVSSWEQPLQDSCVGLARNANKGDWSSVELVDRAEMLRDDDVQSCELLPQALYEYSIAFVCYT